MPKKGSVLESYDGQNQFKVSFMMYVDFEAILNPIQGLSPGPSEPYTKEVNQHIPSGFCVYSKFAYGEVENPLELYRGEDCVEKFCDVLVRNERLLQLLHKNQVLEVLRYGTLDVARSLPIYWTIDRPHHTFHLLG